MRRGRGGGLLGDDSGEEDDITALCDAIEDWDLEACELAEEQGGVPPEPPPEGATTEGRTELTAAQRGAVARIALTISEFFPEQSGPAELKKLEAVALRAFRRADLDYNIDDAVREAGCFHMAEADCAVDCADFDELPVGEGGLVDIAPMVERKKAKLAPNRLSVQRVERSLSRDNPQYEKVMALAVDGIRVRELLPKDFVPDGPERSKWPPQRPKFRKAAAAVETLLQKNFVDKGLAIVLDTERAQRVAGLSIHPSGWAPKAKKPLGRNTGDPVPMNTRHTKLAADEEWGVITHPTIEEFVHSLLDYAEEEGIDWEDIVLVKLDISGAYTLIYIKTEDVALFGTEVTREKVVIYLCGFFGWTGTPAHFHPITLGLKWEIQRVIRGKVGIYVDDILLFTTRQHESHDTAAASSTVQGLLGEGCLEEDKKERGRRVTMVGYDLDLNQRLLAIGDRCVERAVGGFMAVDEDRPVPVRTMQCLASWASRYAKVCIYMSPFVRMLNNAHRGRRQHASIKLGVAAKLAIWVMRALLMLTVVAEQAFTRSFDSWIFRRGDDYVVARFDASLGGLGILWYLRKADGTEILLGGAAPDIGFLSFGTNSGLQNVAEFLAAICAIWGLFVMGMQGLRVNGCFPSRIVLEGDSTAALAWAEAGRVRSDQATNAAIVFILLGVASGIQVLWGTHVPAEKNGRADYMSRLVEEEKTWTGLYEKFPDLVGMRVVDLEADELLGMAAPGNHTESSERFMGMWKGLRTLLGQAGGGGD
mmetsp:Transcript_6972/g.15184  ORF Transcript_6972/g.15184 Transcript_6972/m.15184 type:complete len:762 (-) Transcript_6972:5-2290(-)